MRPPWLAPLWGAPALAGGAGLRARPALRGLHPLRPPPPRRRGRELRRRRDAVPALQLHAVRAERGPGVRAGQRPAGRAGHLLAALLGLSPRARRLAPRDPPSGQRARPRADAQHGFAGATDGGTIPTCSSPGCPSTPAMASMPATSRSSGARPASPWCWRDLGLSQRDEYQRMLGTEIEVEAGAIRIGSGNMPRRWWRPVRQGVTTAHRSTQHPHHRRHIGGHERDRGAGRHGRPSRRLLGQSGWLRGLAAHLVRGGEEADDLVQETWLNALRSPPGAGRPSDLAGAGPAQRLADGRPGGQPPAGPRAGDRVPAPEIPPRAASNGRSSSVTSPSW